VNIFAIEPYDDEGSQCAFYTVRWDDAEKNETDRFFQKFENDERLQRSIQELAKFLTIVIAEEYGALDDFFRFENKAQALPPAGDYQLGEVAFNFGDFPLRLYCLKITNHLVILFNGDEKTSQSAQDGKTSMVFHDANAFAGKIIAALHDRTIIVDEDQRTLLNYKKQKEILL
jgi:hypothetical protein